MGGDLAGFDAESAEAVSGGDAKGLNVGGDDVTVTLFAATTAEGEVSGCLRAYKVSIRIVSSPPTIMKTHGRPPVGMLVPVTGMAVCTGPAAAAWAGSTWVTAG